ncbi:hypothetical protein [Deinococcus sp.]|uniref:hypothetical protein n=1 Tax=Deinococcus sp. TaxID=47478 RepID=UPI0025E35F4C|nr:hypothetical protein [Deinococcus sp.]
MKRVFFVSCLLGLLLSGCRGGTGSLDLTPSAQRFLDEGGETLSNTSNQIYTRPCLQGLILGNTLIDSSLSRTAALVSLVERHDFASTVHAAQSGGYDKVTITPKAPYLANWTGKGDIRFFCFGKLLVTKTEVVPDAQPITAGAAEAYIVKGTEARVVRITFKLTDVPDGDFVAALTQRPDLLLDRAMQPGDYGKALTIVATIPTKPENYDLP